MNRTEATGFGVSLAGHGALLAILSLGLANVRQPPLLNEPMEVSFVEEIDLQSAAPAAEAPAQSIAPELGPPEEPAPAPEPEPLPPAPRPEPVPPLPQPKPVPKAVVPPPPKPTPRPVPKPAPPKVTAKPAPAKPQPKPPAPKAAAKSAPAKTAPAKAAPAKAAPPKAAAAPTGGKGQAQAARGSRLGKDFLKGLGAEPSPATSAKPSGAVMSPIALAGIKSAIQRQIQPCADRQVDPGPGANRIQVTLNLKLRPDGSLASSPSVVRTSGVTQENDRYEKRVADLAIAAYRGCAPLRGLPDELYRTAKGGWSNINMNYKLPG